MTQQGPITSEPSEEQKAVFGRQLRAAMTEAKLTNVALGRACGVGPNVVSDWRAGRAIPKGRVPWLLCMALGCDLWLTLWGDVTTERVAGGRLYSEREVDDRARRIAEDLLAEQLRSLRANRP